MTTPPRRLLDPEQIAIQAGRQMPFLRLPERATVFAERALRLRQLAAGHPMRDYLLFVAELAEAQHRVLQAPPTVAVPDAAACDAAAHALRPPLPWDGAADPGFRALLQALLDTLAPRLSAGPAREAAARLARADDAALATQAERLLGGIGLGLDLAAAPILGAALQLSWTARVLATVDAHGPGAFGRTEAPTHCPCCGSLPVAGVTRIGADESGHRYLHCALCSTQWHYVRIKCARCEGTKGLHYEQLEPGPGAAPRAAAGAQAIGAVRAECCDGCGHYLKLAGMERDPQVEPVADDLASLALDLLVTEAGHERHGANLLLVFGASDSG